VVLIDATLLVHAHNSAFGEHAAARDWLDGQLNGSTAVGIPWASVLAFLRLTTNPRIFERPLAMPLAWSQVDAWLSCDTVWTPHRPIAMEKLSASFWGCRACTPISCLTRISPRWRSSMG
jgi:predicted nucleic acid-binding protein